VRRPDQRDSGRCQFEPGAGRCATSHGRRQTWDKDALSQEGAEKVLNDLKAAAFDYISSGLPGRYRRNRMLMGDAFRR
jgi:hypothetical protein